MSQLLWLSLAACATVPPTPTVEPGALRPNGAPASTPAPPDAWGRRRYHNYYALNRVDGPYHHFAAYFSHIELVTGSCRVGLEPEAPVECWSGGFGLVTERPAPQPIPADIVPMAEAVRRELRANHHAGRDLVVQYLGAYRELHVNEWVGRGPFPYSGDRAYGLTLAASPDLTELYGAAPAGVDSGGNAGPASNGAPHWIDATPGGQGRARLWNVYAEPKESAARRAFDAATLAAAREMVTGRPGPRLEELTIERDDRLLPADLETRRPFGLIVNAVGEWRHQSIARAWIEPSRALGGEERVHLQLSLDHDVTFDLQLAFRALALFPHMRGELDVPITVDYRLSAQGGVRAQPVSGVTVVNARIFADGDRFQVIQLPMPIGKIRFPGGGPYRSFEVYFGFIEED